MQKSKRHLGELIIVAWHENLSWDSLNYSGDKYASIIASTNRSIFRGKSEHGMEIMNIIPQP